MTLDEEIEFWKDRALRSTSDAALVAFGISVGLKIAKHDYRLKGLTINRDVVHEDV